jgi:hypothetical protein
MGITINAEVSLASGTLVFCVPRLSETDIALILPFIVATVSTYIFEQFYLCYCH